VYVTPISAFTSPRGHGVVLLGQNEKLFITCSRCTASSEVFISSGACFVGLASANSSFKSTPTFASLLLGSSSQWEAVLDTSAMPAGQAYRLCVDLDGHIDSTLGPGDSGQFVRISGVLAVSATGLAAGRVTVPLQCSGCSTSTAAYLSSSCS
ncbi:unnamed protein product, partial [Polarella glacialis]